MTQDTSFRFKLLLIVAVFAAPLVAAYLSYHYWPPKSRMNYGELLPLKPLSDASLKTGDGEDFRLSALKGKWVLLQIDSGNCAQACAQKLLQMRQVRLALGKHQDRVERAWLLDDDVLPVAALKSTFAGTHIVRGSASPLLRELSMHTPREHIFLIDPLGNLMMRYPKDADGKRMLRDLSRLLQVSQVG
jgi:hypothetical protein